MTYKGYTGVCEVDEECRDIFGRVVGLRDVITFRGKTFEEAEREFRASVDFYLEMCAKHGEAPDFPCSGRFVARIDPALHQRLAAVARERGLGFDAVVELAFTRFVATTVEPPAVQGAAEVAAVAAR